MECVLTNYPKPQHVLWDHMDAPSEIVGTQIQQEHPYQEDHGGDIPAQHFAMDTSTCAKPSPLHLANDLCHPVPKTGRSSSLELRGLFKSSVAVPLSPDPITQFVAGGCTVTWPWNGSRLSSIFHGTWWNWLTELVALPHVVSWPWIPTKTLTH